MTRIGDPIDVLKEPLPTRAITVTLPLAVIEHYDELAHASRVSRQECLSQILRAAMTNPQAHLPIEGYNPDREGGKAYDIHVRSVEIQREIDAGIR